MQLIGMLDSPYVRRVAVSLRVLGLPSTWTRSRSSAISTTSPPSIPVVKAPSFVTDDGVVLMDSSLILEHIAHLAPRSLMPPDRASHESRCARSGWRWRPATRAFPSCTNATSGRRKSSISPGWTGCGASCWQPMGAGKGSVARLVHRRRTDAAADHHGRGLALQPARLERCPAGRGLPPPVAVVGAGRTAPCLSRNSLSARCGLAPSELWRYFLCCDRIRT